MGSIRPDDAGQGDYDRMDPQAVREQLTRILESDAFKATPQRRQMLSYVVEETLAGRSDRIKGYTIGVHVIGRSKDFDPNADPVVRLEARRLRHDLDSYYVAAGRDDPIRISIPTGRYVPQFTRQDIAATPFEPEEAPEETTPDETAVRRDWRPRWLAAAVVAAVALIIWTFAQRPDTSATLVESPAVVVLPFEVLSHNEEDEFFAAGVTSRIVSDLSRFPDIRLYSPQMGFLQSASTDPISLGKGMGISYVVAGDLRSRAKSVTVGVRLIDTRSGQIVWTDTYDRALTTGLVSDIQRDIASGIASALGQPYGVIRTALTNELSDSAAQRQSSYECVLRGYHFRRTWSPALYEPVLTCLNEAVRNDPNYAEAWAMLATLHYASAALSIIPSDPAITFDSAAEAALQAVELDPDNAMGLKVLSLTEFYRGNYDEAERFARQAVEANPNDPDSLFQLGWRLAIRNNFKEGVPLIEDAIERSINPPGRYYHLLAVDRLMKGDGEGMLALAQRAAADGSAISQSLIVMACGLIGDREGAERAIARMNEITPGYDPIQRWRAHQATDEILAAMNDAFGLASVPPSGNLGGQN